MATAGTKPLKPIKFSLTNKNNVETFINFAPDGWDESQIQCTRTNYYSVSEKFTTQLQFVKDGASLLKSIFYADGFEAYCLMKIYQLNPKTGLYKVVYSGEIDFSTFEHEDYIVKCIANENDFWTKLKANESTEYEIDIDNGSSLTVEATFPYLEENYNVVCNFDNTILQNIVIFGNNEYSSEINLRGVSFYSNTTVSGAGTPNVQPSFVVDKIITMPTLYINGEISVCVLPNIIGEQFIIKFFANVFNGLTNTILPLQNITYTASGIGVYDVFNLSSSISLGTLNINDSISICSIVTDINNINVNNPLYIVGDVYNVLEYNVQPPAKSIKALTPTTVLNQLITKINDGTSIPLDVTFLNQISDYLFTSGDAIRGLTGSKLKLSFKKYFEYLDSKFCVGFGFENGKATLRERVHFYDNTLIYDLGEVRDLSLSIHKTYISNTIQIGTKEQTYDDVNGRYEFNQQQNWNNGIKKIKKLLDLSTDIRDDVYGIIFTSLNLEGKSTTDSADDNDTFCMHTKLNGAVINFNRDYDTTTVVGFPDRDNLFNYKLSPKRCLLRNSAFLATFLHNNTNETVLDSALKNSDFGVKANDETAVIIEKDKLLKSELNSALYQPYLINFVVPIRTDLTDFINLATNGYFQFTWKGETYKGFIEDLSVATIKLISHSTNDLTKLI